MEFRAAETEEPEINLTSLIDVVFLLLIFFMVTTTFERQAVVQVQLPKATTAVRAQQDLVLELVIDRDGRMYLNGVPLLNNNRSTMRVALTEVAGDRRDVPLVIRADASTAHQDVVKAMDVAGSLGFTRLSIATNEVLLDDE
ncbi:MAG TPA: biopolymer transporter ExbD [Kiloniellaceae bacterium]|nr:biopolymer transporter ExbD [Kiloniellaceae bacterium]